MESTIVDLTGERPRLLRPGGVTPEELRALLGELDIDRAVLGQISNDAVVRAPGMKYKHYAPSAEVYIISGSSEAAAHYIRRHFGPGDAVLCFAEELPLYDGCNPTAYGPKTMCARSLPGCLPPCATSTGRISARSTPAAPRAAAWPTPSATA